MKKKYSLDPSNRLVIRQEQKRIVAGGSFKADAKNRLIYLLSDPPQWRRKYGLGRQITFEGRWRLNADQELELNVGRAREQADESRLALGGRIISVEGNALAFQVQSRDRNGNSHIRIIKLGGAWQADERNRLTFIVQKKSPDILTLEGAWQVNKNQQITYKYEKTGLKSSARAVQALDFEGFWDISEKNRLTYILSGSSRSRFDFRVQAGSPSMYPQEGKIKYLLGAGVKQELRPRAKVVYLYGAWKFSRSGGLSFQVDYGRGRFQAIEFGADLRLDRQDKLTFSLTNRKGEVLGVSVTFTHSFLKASGAEAFLRLKTGRSGPGIDAGVQIPF